MKSSEVSIKTRSPPASLSFKGQATKHTTVKWSIEMKYLSFEFSLIKWTPQDNDPHPLGLKITWCASYLQFSSE